jgi:nucleoside-diphosphate-sugar epimerase
MRYFVTGATGFIGQELVLQLLAAGHEVTAVVRDPQTVAAAPSHPLAQPGVHLVKADVGGKESMRGPMGGVDGVFHVAGWYRIGAPDRAAAFRTNVDGTRNVLELMKEFGIPRGVYTSSLAVFSDTHGRVMDEEYVFRGKHISVYDLTKWIAHYEVALPMMRDGLPLAIVQPGAVYGPGDRGPLAQLIEVYLRRELPTVPAKVAYCWGHVTDIARAHILAMDRGKSGESYIIAGPCHELGEVLRMLEKMTAVSLPRLTMPPFALKAPARLMGVIERFHQVDVARSSEALRVLAGPTYLGSNAKAKAELGIEMRPIEQGLKETLDWYLQLAKEGR